MSTLDTTTFLYTEDRGFQVPITLEHDNIVGTECCDKTSNRNHQCVLHSTRLHYTELGRRRHRVGWVVMTVLL
jgi:hypothetical protein